MKAKIFSFVCKISGFQKFGKLSRRAGRCRPPARSRLSKECGGTLSTFKFCVGKAAPFLLRSNARRASDAPRSDCGASILLLLNFGLYSKYLLLILTKRKTKYGG